MTFLTQDEAGGSMPAGDDGGPVPARFSGRQLRELIVDDARLDEVIDRADEGGVSLTGPGGFLPEMIKAVLERGLGAELTGHLGYEVGDPAGRGSPNSRNGHSPRQLGQLPREGDTFRESFVLSVAKKTSSSRSRTKRELAVPFSRAPV